MDFQPKTEPGLPPTPTPNPASSTSHESFHGMSISELVSDLRGNCDKVEEVFVAKDAKHKAEIGSLSVKYELERLQRLHIEDELKKKEQEYLNLERKWLDDRNAVAALRIRCCELEEQNKKNLKTIQKLMDGNCRLGKEKCNADAKLLNEMVVLDSSPLKRKKVVGHCIGESDIMTCSLDINRQDERWHIVGALDFERQSTAACMVDGGGGLLGGINEAMADTGGSRGDGRETGGSARGGRGGERQRHRQAAAAAASGTPLAEDIYRLDQVSHVAASLHSQAPHLVDSRGYELKIRLDERMMPLIEEAGFGDVARANIRWSRVDEPLVSAFIERWRPETHTFHMPFGECTVTLQDVAYLLGLPINGEPVSGCMNDFEQFYEGKETWAWFQELFGQLPPPQKMKKHTVCFTWFETTFAQLPREASALTVTYFSRAYLIMLLSSQLFGDKSMGRVHMRWLPFIANIGKMRTYSWGSGVLALLYRGLCRCANQQTTTLAGCLILLQSWIFSRFPTFCPSTYQGVVRWPLAASWVRDTPLNGSREARLVEARYRLDTLTADQFVWRPYDNPSVNAVIPPEILEDQHRTLWRSVTALIYFAQIEWHQPDRVIGQLGGRQRVPGPARCLDLLHTQDARGKDYWWPTKRKEWHERWDKRYENLVVFDLVSDTRLSIEYETWWVQSCKRRFLSEEAWLADPRQRGAPPYAADIQSPSRHGPAPLLARPQAVARALVGTSASPSDHPRQDSTVDNDDKDNGDASHGGGSASGGRGDDVSVVGSGGWSSSMTLPSPLSQVFHEFGRSSSQLSPGSMS